MRVGPLCAFGRPPEFHGIGGISPREVVSADGRSGEIDRRRLIEGEQGKKKKRKKKKEEERTLRHPRSRAVTARGSPASHRSPRLRAIFLPREETECLPA
ncbi:hypothetical protein B296_00032364 [Ensete ventricosum]|uniref:Uncharacterized protein n=1 Tax=Ensete ventricosum TaxID=4639 RepID=A0A427A254_ENSVE|nr:hypothetical protein B296_00032364 [Ensete ventricosum]